jgi:hypothetical protein
VMPWHDGLPKMICYTYVFWLSVRWIKPTFIYAALAFRKNTAREPCIWKNIDFLDINVFISLLGDKTLHDNSKFKEY